jgi:hypothetical protein
MSFESRVVKNAQTVEYGKFVELKDDSRFPAISVTRVQYPDQSSAFPNNQGAPPLTSVEVYPKFAVITHDVGSGGAGPGGAYTKCETRNSGNPSFISSKIFIYNSTNQFADVILTLTSGLSCMINLGKHNESNHTFTENLAVSGVNDYDGCTITYFA